MAINDGDDDDDDDDDAGGDGGGGGDRVPCCHESIGRCCLPLIVLEPICGYTTKSVMHGQCIDRPVVILPALERHHPLTDQLILPDDRGTQV